MAGSGRLVATREAERVEACPACGAANPDPESGRLCPSCGAVLGSRSRKLLRFGLIGLAAAGGLLLLGLLATVAARGWGGGATIGLAVVLDVLGAALLAAAGLVVWRVVQDVTVRETPEAQRFVGRTGKLAAGGLGGMLAVAAALLVFVLLAARGDRPKIEAAFAGKLAPWLGLADKVGATPGEAGPANPKIKPKLLVLDRLVRHSDAPLDEEDPKPAPGVHRGGLSEVHFVLPSELHASQPEQAATLVVLDWEAVLRGNYTDKRTDKSVGGAYQWRCQPTLIDKATEKVLARPEPFEGGPPPQSSPSGGDAYGSRPIQQIVAWLTALPRE
jgi:hypothetical protein